MASIEPVHPTKRNVFSSVFVWINRPMLVLSVLIHIGLLSIPLPENSPSAPEEAPEEVSGITDLSQVTLATSPLGERTAQAVPSTVPSSAQPKVKVDLSRAPRPPKLIRPAQPSQSKVVQPRVAQPQIRQPAIVQPQIPRPTPRKSATPAPRVSPASTVVPVPSIAPTALPVTTPPPPPPEETAVIPESPPGGEGLSEEAARALFDQFRRNSPGSGRGQVYPTALEQPSAFFKPQVQENSTATEMDCLGLMLACWWDEQQNPETVKERLQGEELFQNITLEEIPGGYAGGGLYRLLSKTTGEPTTWYLTLVKSQGTTTKGTMVGFWRTDPRIFPSF